MTLPDLELFVESLCKDLEINYYKIDACLGHRKYLLDGMFQCTPENVERLHRIATLVKERTAMLCEKGNHLYKQMLQLWEENKNEPFTDFRIDLSLEISHNCEDSILCLDDDNSGSNYLKMSELLNDFYFSFFRRGNLIYNDRLNYDPEEKIERTFQPFELCCESEDTINYWGESWFFDKFPTLQDLPITWEFHNLLFHSNYALQDIIRINDVWSEVNVVWQHIAGQ